MAKADGESRYCQPKFGWRFFGRELKRRREAAKLSQDELGRRVICSGSYIGQFEKALRKPQLEIAVRLDAVLGTDGLFARMCEELIDNPSYADCFREVAYLQGLATSIREYAPIFVPGLLQTAAYARAVFLGGHPFASEEDIESRVTNRLARARILRDPTKPLLWALLDESVIRRKVGGAAAMHEQLSHIAALVRRRHIGLQVLPFDAGAPLLDGALTLMAFEDVPPVAYSEGHLSGNLLDDPSVVEECERSYDFATAVALSPAESLSLITSVAEEYGHE
ncbi:helix-turn-helix transcriptional regulator [Streptomyces mobaraensis NBRC 13819 = DSM 40847]|uniref:DNA-binding protein n=1 Tax=Streptomyces mobaraensis (strain ATCC 29032 / DSM 40847 / JCM 4168 / NBRC 13819 / NCIMB 11159 / IPCR 16-22) TaxID=1223523 RepID=M2ZYZ5_STRM1|nr:helix-turn-helix transcriptional regulator [Streptomyces mobaraensis]EME97993.1 DNA-binding protein [Streptomyces mobaraensis NBRC 13819 = DSM 40847]QTT74365.1 helix-turn-helix transcriptional regulator [Streptomyces mobaraensis NBRC 13819 = DSM 40847]